MNEGKIAVITGATRGIGRNMALFFAKNGWTVAGTGRSQEKLASMRAELKALSGDNEMFSLDVTDLQAVQQTAMAIKQRYGKIDVWINNAGAFQAIGPTWEVRAEDWISDIQTNLFGSFFCVQAVVPVMLEQGFGRVINLAGGGTIQAFAYGNAYGTSKTAIARFTENLAEELRETPLTVFALDPGLNDTDMTRYQRTAKEGQQYLGRVEQLFQENVDLPPDQAPQVAHAIARGELDSWSGKILFAAEGLEAVKEKKEKTKADSFAKLRLQQ